MFGILPPGVRISESYSDFTEETLLTPAPIQCWPSVLGNLASEAIKENVANESDEHVIKVLVCNGGAGRISLELLRNCSNLDITHVSQSRSYNLLEQLLDEGCLQWQQPVEGKIAETRTYKLMEAESRQSLLDCKNNKINFLNTDIDSLTLKKKKFQVVVADLRCKNSGADIKCLNRLMGDDGLLILGSVDDIDEEYPSKEHSGAALPVFFDRVSQTNNEAMFPHIYKETRNKHQFTISYFSVWKKKMSDEDSASFYVSGLPRGTSNAKDAVEYYESTNILTSYDIFHFGEGLLSVKNFPLRMSEVCIEACNKYKTDFKFALDAGSGPGRTAIELCKVFSKVYAYDYSDGFVENMLVKARDAGLSNLEGRQGDSHCQSDMYPDTKFDLIFGCNLIDRLHTPQQWVQQSKEMLSKTGILVISSPYTWKPEHTDLEKWIGGFVEKEEKIYTQDGLEKLLGPEMKLFESQKIPFVIPDSDGTFQYTYSNCTIFGFK